MNTNKEDIKKFVSALIEELNDLEQVLARSEELEIENKKNERYKELKRLLDTIK